jgi:hypothetical protein
MFLPDCEATKSRYGSFHRHLRFPKTKRQHSRNKTLAYILIGGLTPRVTYRILKTGHPHPTQKISSRH